MYRNAHDVLAHAVTRFDRTRRRPQNPYALGHYLLAVERADDAMAKGATIEQACCEQFNGALLKYVLKFVAKHYRVNG